MGGWILEGEGGRGEATIESGTAEGRATDLLRRCTALRSVPLFPSCALWAGVVVSRSRCSPSLFVCVIWFGVVIALRPLS